MSSSDQSFSNDPKLNAAQIRQKSVRGGKITLVSRFASVGLQLASTVTVARLLGPAEYGVIAMVTAITTFAGLFRDLGLSSATIQKDKLSHDQLSTLYWINVAAGASLTLIVAACSPLVAWFYQRPELTLVTLALSSKFFINGFTTQQSAILLRQFKFGQHAAANLSGSASGLLLAIVFASNGYGYWALVISAIGGSIVTTTIFNLASSWRPGRPKRGTGIRSMLKYGLNITGFEIINFFSRNLDNILIGKFWGAEILGIYNRAYQLMMLPISNLRNPINAAVFPALSRLQANPQDYKQYYIQSVFLISILGMPAMAFLFVAAEPFVLILLGPKWSEVVPIFKILTIVAFIQPSISLVGLAMLSSGQANRNLKLGLCNSVVTVVGFIAGLPWGAAGVATAYAVTNYLLVHPNLVVAFKGSCLRPADYYRSIVPPALASALAAAAAFFLAPLIPGIHEHYELTVVIASVFIVAFFAIIKVLSIFDNQTKDNCKSIPLLKRII